MSMIELVITLGLLELELFELVRKLYCKRVILHDRCHDRHKVNCECGLPHYTDIVIVLAYD